MCVPKNLLESRILVNSIWETETRAAFYFWAKFLKELKLHGNLKSKWNSDILKNASLFYARPTTKIWDTLDYSIYLVVSIHMNKIEKYQKIFYQSLIVFISVFLIFSYIFFFRSELAVWQVGKLMYYYSFISVILTLS